LNRLCPIQGLTLLLSQWNSDNVPYLKTQDEGAGGEQGGYKDREVDGGKQEDKESGKEANFYFPWLTPFFPHITISRI